MQLEQYLKVFRDQNILITRSEDLNTNNRAVIKRVFEFLNVDSFFYHDKFVNILHKSSRKRRKSQTAQFLRRKSVIKNIDKLPYSFRSYIDWLVFWPFSRNVNRPVLSETLKQIIIDYLRVEKRVAFLQSVRYGVILIVNSNSIFHYSIV